MTYPYRARITIADVTPLLHLSSLEGREVEAMVYHEDSAIAETEYGVTSLYCRNGHWAVIDNMTYPLLREHVRAVLPLLIARDLAP